MSEQDSDKEIIVTPEMIRAGAWAIVSFCDDFGPYDLAEEVYTAMARAAPRSPQDRP